jgi:hypothetical protein
MSRIHRVRQGECLVSISFEKGLLPDTIWRHPANDELRRLRSNQHVLLPGDELRIPRIESRAEQAATGQRHRFVRHGVPARMRLRILHRPGAPDENNEDGELDHEESDDQPNSREQEPAHSEPRSHTRYVVHIGGQSYEGTTDEAGCLEVPIPPTAEKALVILGEAPHQEQMEVSLGIVDPVEEISGVQQRLVNLGYTPGPVDGILGPQTRAALRAFQADRGLRGSGEPDSATRDELVTAHGS